MEQIPGAIFQGRGLRSTTIVIILKCSSWPVVFKSSVCHHGKPGITPVFKMASKTAVSYRNDPWNNNARLNQILPINFVFEHPYQYVKMLTEYIYRYIKMAATTFSMVADYLTPLCAIVIVSLA